jgi:Coenzyme PQQ synthesis protein D (PqqD)
LKVNSPQVNHQNIDGEVVVINLENGCYYSLLELSAAIWQSLVSGTDRVAILEQVSAGYPDVPDAAERADAFIDELLAERLLVDGMLDGAPDRAVPPGDLPARYTAPQVEKFTDMQELLMLDPIHEVDAIGWPHKPSGS